MGKQLYSLGEVINLIEEKKSLIITADEGMLAQLPKGNWIGGTLPYFMTDNGFIKTKDQLYVNDLTNYGINFKYSKYDTSTISSIATDGFDNGFTFVIMPAGSDVHGVYSLNALQFENIFKNPVFGYASGFDFEDANHTGPKAFFGPDSEMLSAGAVAIHVELPENQVARVEILNPYAIDEQSDEIMFPEDSFIQTTCTVNGEEANIYDYLTSIGYELPCAPLISNTAGALINRAVMFMNPENKSVGFHSPVFKGDTYRLAEKVTDYKALFAEKLTINKKEAAYSCLCYGFKLAANITNETLNINGPFVFNEIAYQALNETAVYLMIDTY